MPEEGILLSPPEHNLPTPKIVYISELFVKEVVTKIRLTGGKLTFRKGILSLVRQVGSHRKHGLKKLCLTTNGVSLSFKLDSLIESGVTGINLSFDMLDPFQFALMTRRSAQTFETVMHSVRRMPEMNRPGARVKLKINCVVMRGLNEREVIPFVEPGKNEDTEV